MSENEKINAPGEDNVSGNEQTNREKNDGNRHGRNDRRKKHHGNRSEAEAALPAGDTVPGAGKARSIPPKATIPPKAPIQGKDGTKAAESEKPRQEQNAKPQNAKGGIPPKAPVAGQPGNQPKEKAAKLPPQQKQERFEKQEKQDRFEKQEKQDRAPKPLRETPATAPAAAAPVKEFKKNKDKREKQRPQKETPAELEGLLNDTPDYLPAGTGNALFGFQKSNEIEDKILDSMPLDPTLDDVFALPADLAKPETEPADGVEIVGIHFPQGGKVYYFDPIGIKFAKGDTAIVETARGAELGEVAIPNKKVPESSIVQPLKPVIRKANKYDLEHDAENKKREKESEAICLEKIAARGLDMKLVGAQYTFDNSKLIFYFTAAQRVDFRELVKDLAAVFHTRIELRQIGIRDEARMLGGKGSCGRKLCCSSFLPNYAQVTIKMAKEQGLALTSSKISGNCGRLMCCLRFEQSAYDEELAALPTVDSVVDTPDGNGIVIELKPMSQSVRVKLTGKDEAPRIYKSADIKVLVLAEPRADENDYRPGKKRDRDNQNDPDIPVD